MTFRIVNREEGSRKNWDQIKKRELDGGQDPIGGGTPKREAGHTGRRFQGGKDLEIISIESRGPNRGGEWKGGAKKLERGIKNQSAQRKGTLFGHQKRKDKTDKKKKGARRVRPPGEKTMESPKKGMTRSSVLGATPKGRD